MGGQSYINTRKARPMDARAMREFLAWFYRSCKPRIWYPAERIFSRLYFAYLSPYLAICREILLALLEKQSSTLTVRDRDNFFQFI